MGAGTSMKSASHLLRKRLETEEVLILPGAFNALSAKMIEKAGFEAIYASGAGITNAYLGLPDLGLLTADELINNVRAISDVVSIPVIVDIDTGFGGVHNIARLIRQIENANVAGVQIEDQIFPKRCGHFDRKQVVPIEEMIDRIVAATESRRKDLLVIARTDAIAVENFTSAIDRAQEYLNAGADIIFIEALETRDQICDAAKAISGKKLINMVEGGRTPFLTTKELDALGYDIILFANFALRVTMKALKKTLVALREQKSTEALFEDILTWEERQETVGLDRYEETESKWKVRSKGLLEANKRR
jgi:2-methylisocitrate lyase-like PEP mutase family enzyme